MRWGARTRLPSGFPRMRRLRAMKKTKRFVMICGRYSSRRIPGPCLSTQFSITLYTIVEEVRWYIRPYFFHTINVHVTRAFAHASS